MTMVPPLHVVRLIEALAEYVGEPIDSYGKMSDAIDGKLYISPRYLRERYQSARSDYEAGMKLVRISLDHMNIISGQMGFRNFQEFEKSCDRKISDTLRSCVGNWWSYVRANSGEAILKAPVRIFIDERRNLVRLELQGNERAFAGYIEEEGGCLSGFLKSGIDKRIGLVFKLGNSKQIDLLQGVFCGISSLGDPIAGREILVREHELPYEQMEWADLPLNDRRLDKRIRDYFADRRENCIKVREVTGFSLSHL